MTDNNMPDNKLPDENMPDENKPELTDEELKEVAQSVPPPDEYVEGEAEALEERLDEEGDETLIEEASVDALEASEEASHSPVAEAWDKAVTGLTDTLESMAEGEVDAKSGSAELHLVYEHHDDTTVFMGREYPVPVYTFVFLVLGALTLIEVMVAEIFDANVIRVPVLLGLAGFKSVLVMYFYMHLREDSRIFALSVILPFIVALLSLMFLFAVPNAGY